MTTTTISQLMLPAPKELLMLTAPHVPLLLAASIPPRPVAVAGARSVRGSNRGVYVDTPKPIEKFLMNLSGKAAA